jgi:hypothetical protein
MGGIKNQLLKYQTVTNGSMTGTSTITSAVTNIQNMDNVGIQLNFTGTPNGTFFVQVSADYAQNSQGVVTNAGNWITVTLPTTPVAAGAANQIYIDMNQLSAPWIRFQYTNSSGAGTLNAFITGKALGG